MIQLLLGRITSQQPDNRTILSLAVLAPCTTHEALPARVCRHAARRDATTGAAAAAGRSTDGGHEWGASWHAAGRSAARHGTWLSWCALTRV